MKMAPSSHFSQPVTEGLGGATQSARFRSGSAACGPGRGGGSHESTEGGDLVARSSRHVGGTPFPPSLWQCPSVAEASHCCGIGKGARCPPRPPMAFWALRPKTSTGGTVHRSRKTPLALQVMMCTLCGSGNCFIM